MALFPRKASDKRKQYRVKTDSALAVSLLHGEQWGATPLLDVSARGAAILLTPEMARSFEVDRGLSIRFVLRGRGKAIETTAVVRSTEEVQSQLGDGFRIGVEFTQADALYSELDAGYWPYFNRRKSFRVQPSGEKPEVGVTWPGKQLVGRLDELSISGCAVSFERETLLLLVPGSKVQLEFQIPDTELRGRFTSSVVHRGVRKSRLGIGYTFEASESTNFPELQELIRAHVMRRQREVLQGGD